MSLPDLMFLLAESPSQPMRIGGVLLFGGDGRSGPEEVERRLLPRLRLPAEVDPLLTLLPAPGAVPGLPSRRWLRQQPRQEQHVHLHRLREGSRDELHAALAAEHARPLERDRPLWEAHVYTGLEDGGAAVYCAVHHSLMDGMQALGLATRHRPGGDLVLPWEDADDVQAPRARVQSERPGPTGPARPPLRSLVQPVRRSRRTQAWRRAVGPDRALEVFDVPGTAPGGQGTDNDRLLAACGAALRAYDGTHGSDGPTRAAMVPVALAGTGRGGNIAAAARCDLHTDVADRAEREALVRQQVRAAATAFRSLGAQRSGLLSAVLMSRQLLNCLLPAPVCDAGFDLVVSSLRSGSPADLHLAGLPLRQIVPLSVLGNGQPVNVTALSRGGRMTVAVLYDPARVQGRRLADLLARELQR